MAQIPIGGIIVWTNLPVPANYHLCDGTGGTPDLRTKMVLGAGGTVAAGATGGTSSVDIGNHHHHVGTLMATGAPAGEHTHAVSLNIANTAACGAGEGLVARGECENHGHTASGNSSSEAAHTHSQPWTGQTDDKDPVWSAPKMPPFINMNFIMRMS